jgi:hypothetical protein
VLKSQIDTPFQSWIVRLNVDGKEGDFFIGLQTAKSEVSRAFARNAKTVNVSTNGRKLATVAVVEDDDLELSGGKKAAGIIGRDVLEKYSLGFDVMAKTLTLWEGKRTESEVSAWLGVPAAKAPMKLTPKGALCVGVSLRGKPLWLLPDLGGEETMLLPSVGKGDDVALPSPEVAGQVKADPRWLTVGFEIAGVRTPVAQYDRILSLPKKYEGADGVLPVFKFPGLRVVMDVASKAMWVEKRSEDEMLSRALTDAMRIPLRIEGSGIVVGTSDDPFYASLAPLAGKPIVRLDEQGAESIVSALRGPRRLVTFQSLVSMALNGYRALVMTDESHATPIEVKPLGQP